MTLLVVYLLVALGISTLCSLLEAGLLSLPRAHVTLMAGRGQRAGVMLQNMQREIDEPLSAILTFNTIAHTIGAAGVGAQAQILWGEEWLGIVTAILTFLILVFSEILPKTVGARFAKGLATFTAYATRALTYMTWPIVKVLQLISGLIGGAHGQDISRDEVVVMAKLAQAQGNVREKEYMMIHNLFRLDRVHVKDIMTPRTVVRTLAEEATVADVVAATGGHFPFARMLVTKGPGGEVVGKVLRMKVLQAWGADQSGKKIGELMKPVHAVVEKTSVGEAFKTFVERHEHLFIVIDEFGDLAGVVTMEDALETLLGFEIQDETDPALDMREYAKQQAEVRRKDRDRLRNVRGKK